MQEQNNPQPAYTVCWNTSKRFLQLWTVWLESCLVLMPFLSWFTSSPIFLQMWVASRSWTGYCGSWSKHFWSTVDGSFRRELKCSTHLFNTSSFLFIFYNESVAISRLQLCCSWIGWTVDGFEGVEKQLWIVSVRLRVALQFCLSFPSTTNFAFFSVTMDWLIDFCLFVSLLNV